MGPLRETKMWNPKGVEGVHRFLARVYRLVKFGGAAPPVDGDGASSDMSHITDDAPTPEQLGHLQKAVKYLRQHYPNIEIVALWVDENWQVFEIGQE